MGPEFKLTYKLSDNQVNAAQVMARLSAEDSTDALVGLGLPGLLRPRCHTLNSWLQLCSLPLLDRIRGCWSRKV